MNRQRAPVMEVGAMDTSNDRWDVVVAGFGSPHGDDRAGWDVTTQLAKCEQLPARIVAIREGTQLIGELHECRKLIVIDACRSCQPVGTISRFCWPDPRIRQHHNHSTHGIGLCNTLELAERLQRRPPEVEVFGIEIRGLNPIGELSWEVRRAVEEVAEIIHAELSEAIHA
jgi:hydrogenase maturation protease